MVLVIEHQRASILDSCKDPMKRCSTFPIFNYNPPKTLSCLWDEFHSINAPSMHGIIKTISSSEFFALGSGIILKSIRI